tara:strand:+ start:2064 stop:2345 length:282 start_codon:yes stop_codon:yes gene_type:complete
MKLVVNHLTMEPSKWGALELSLKLLSLKDDNDNHIVYIKPSRRHIKYLKNIEIKINQNELKEVVSDKVYKELFDEPLEGQITKSQGIYCDSCD